MGISVWDFWELQTTGRVSSFPSGELMSAQISGDLVGILQIQAMVLVNFTKNDADDGMP